MGDSETCLLKPSKEVEEAKKLIQAKIDDGQALHCKEVENEREYKIFLDEIDKWDKCGYALLKNLFSDDTKANEFYPRFQWDFGKEILPKRLKYQRSDIYEGIETLKSIKECLSFS